MIDWYSADSQLLLNPRLPDGERTRLERLFGAVSTFPGHVWLATSGTSGSLKLVGLSKDALLASAGAVNRHLGVVPTDVWCCVLPTFHVGGLGIYARAELSGSGVVAFAWDPRRFTTERFTLASLVPAQVDDLVRGGFRAPGQVRAVIVGGGVLHQRLYEAGQALGWPLLPSYGLTEAGSQVATATAGSQTLRVLDHVEVRVERGRIAVKGASLLTGYGVWSEEGEPLFVDPKIDGWFDTGDAGSVEGGVLEVRGRGADFAKVGGESVDLVRLDGILEGVGGGDGAVVAYPDARLGAVIHLVVAEGVDPGVVETFNGRVQPFERARAVWVVEEVPRTALGKVRRSELVHLLQDGRYCRRIDVAAMPGPLE